MKLVESQLLASLAAANARSDAAALRAQRLAAALESANAKTTQQQQQQYVDGPAAGCSGEADLALQVAQLTAQAASRSQEVYHLQDQLLQSKQVRQQGIHQQCACAIANVDGNLHVYSSAARKLCMRVAGVDESRHLQPQFGASVSDVLYC